MTTTYWAAPEVEEIAEKLIADYHTHLGDERIRYVFRDPPAKTKGHIALGKARKVGGLNAHLVQLVGRERIAGPVDFFVVEIAFEPWGQMDEKARIALVDHELCHFEIVEPDKPDDHRKLAIKGHDLEEFHEIVRRHGFWQPSIRELVDAANSQLELNIAGDSEDEPA